MSTKINLPNMAELIKTSSEFNPTIKLDEFSSNPDAFIILLNAFNSNSKLSIDALIDGLIALYHETNISALREAGGYFWEFF